MPGLACATQRSVVEFDPALASGVAELAEWISAGRLDCARARAGELLERYPQQAELWRLLGICTLQQGDHAEAQKALATALELAPQSVEVWCNLASVHTARGQLEDAERALRRALSLEPDHPAALNNLGSLLDARGDYHGAADCFARAIARRPDYARAWLNQAGALLTLRRLDRAEASVRRAIQLAPQWADAHFVLGNVLTESGKPGEAEGAYRDATRCAPGDPRYHYQLALLLDQRGDFAGALPAYEHALQIQPTFWPALSQLVYLKRRLCDWHQLAPLSQRLVDGVIGGAEGITPFSFLAEDSTPAQQLACAQRFAGVKRAQVAPLQRRLAMGSHARAPGPIRVGFVSAGFGEHPTALLIVELIERLRRSELHTVGFATTADDHGGLRARLTRGFHEFHDLSDLPLQAMLRALREAQINILVDVDGYCEHSRPELFALRAAPVQVNWLAYPGSLGAPWYEYLIADHQLIPADQRAHYQERIGWLPRCYQPTDTTRVVPPAPPRSFFQLPEQATVFVSFNNSWKFTLRSFARWMRILKRVPDGVLWLLTGPEGSGADERLRQAAHAAGVDPARLIFAERVRHAEHLARYRHADLFLDTNPYNAHTTASDALWAGCPVLTQRGATFAARVAASLNHHLGLDDMTVDSDHDYIELAVRLGCDRDALRELRRRVQSAAGRSGLFDMDGYARDFEALLTAMFKRHEAGYDATDIEVGKIEAGS
jgi:predicted O-linked N-acetylglucosamine transferase (SPINDLY family)